MRLQAGRHLKNILETVMTASAVAVAVAVAGDDDRDFDFNLTLSETAVILLYLDTGVFILVADN